MGLKRNSLIVPQIPPVQHVRKVHPKDKTIYSDDTCKEVTSQINHIKAKMPLRVVGNIIRGGVA